MMFGATPAARAGPGTGARARAPRERPGKRRRSPGAHQPDGAPAQDLAARGGSRLTRGPSGPAGRPSSPRCYRAEISRQLLLDRSAQPRGDLLRPAASFGRIVHRLDDDRRPERDTHPCPTGPLRPAAVLGAGDRTRHERGAGPQRSSTAPRRRPATSTARRTSPTVLDPSRSTAVRSTPNPSSSAAPSSANASESNPTSDTGIVSPSGPPPASSCISASARSRGPP